MANIIHMETDMVQAVAVKLDQTSLEIHQEISALRNSIRSMNWQGGGSDEFFRDFKRLEESFANLSEQGVLLSRRIKSEMDEWILVASVLVAGSSPIVNQREKAISDTRMSIQDSWKDMSFEDREKWLEDWYKKLCKKLGIPPTDFKVEDLPDPENGDYRGVYNNGGIFGWFRSLTVDADNVKADDPFSVMDTVGHETRHQYQHYLVDHPDKRPADISEDTIKSWKDNFDNYKRAENDYEAYRNQPIEVDARQAGERAGTEYVREEAKVI